MRITRPSDIDINTVSKIYLRRISERQSFGSVLGYAQRALKYLIGNRLWRYAQGGQGPLNILNEAL
jgi:hypothetical protein